MKKKLEFVLSFLTLTSALAGNGASTDWVQGELNLTNAQITTLKTFVDERLLGFSYTLPAYTSTCDSARGACLVFTTAVRVTGDMVVASNNPFNVVPSPTTGIDAANSICQQEGNARFGTQTTKTWKAWLSSSTQNASEAVYNANKIYFNEGGLQLAAANTLLQPELEAAQIILLNTITPGGALVWTGTQADGTVDGDTCTEWTSSSDTSSGAIGSSTARTTNWTDVFAASGKCNVGHALYCFEKP